MVQHVSTITFVKQTDTIFHVLLLSNKDDYIILLYNVIYIVFIFTNEIVFTRID